jgi:hypothetical protein
MGTGGGGRRVWRISGLRADEGGDRGNSPATGAPSEGARKDKEIIRGGLYVKLGGTLAEEIGSSQIGSGDHQVHIRCLEAQAWVCPSERLHLGRDSPSASTPAQARPRQGRFRVRCK